jgi:hypothetical protein
MLFLQPVVVDDAVATDRSTPPAEVRMAERQSLEPPRWTGLMLAQSSIDQRSPFGTNAPNANDGTPDFVPRNPAANTPTPNQVGSSPIGDPSSTTKIPPPSGVPDAGPPPPLGGSSTPGASPSTTAPGTTVPSPSLNAPTTTTPGAVNGLSGTTTAPGGVTPPPQPPGGSSTIISPSVSPTYPGASSGASNTR